jgi:hypothetical protein
MRIRPTPPRAMATLATLVAGVYACSSFSSTDGPTADGGDGGGDGGDAAAASDGGVADASERDAFATPPDASPSDAGPGTDPGCADGTREGFHDVATFPHVAACAGAFLVGGLRVPDQRTCSSEGGNNGTHAGGQGCSAGDLCALGWHVCKNGDDFVASGTNVTCAAAVASAALSETTFYASAQPSHGTGICDSSAADDGGTDDVFGCGTGGTLTVGMGACGPFDATLGGGCGNDSVHWACGPMSSDERSVVKKSSGAGGVLCCHD